MKCVLDIVVSQDSKLNPMFELNSFFSWLQYVIKYSKGLPISVVVLSYYFGLTFGQVDKALTSLRSEMDMLL